MGQCGCGDHHADYKFEGPDGVLYAVGVYTGCEGCDTPAGVTLYRHAQPDREWSDDCPALDFGAFMGDAPIAIIDLRQLQTFLRKAIDDARSDPHWDELDEPVHPADWLDWEVFGDAIEATVKASPSLKPNPKKREKCSACKGKGWVGGLVGDSRPCPKCQMGF